MLVTKLLLLSFLSISVLPTSRGLRWHRGCMCELPSDDHQDEDGAFSYEGRVDDMMKVGGLWVSPIEIENRRCL